MTVMPGNTSSRCAAITSSSSTSRVPASSAGSSRGSSGGTLTRAKCSAPFASSATTTARFRDSPEMYGNGWAGSTASGVRTGWICWANRSSNRRRSLLLRSDQRTTARPLLGQRGQQLGGDELGLRQHHLVRQLGDPVQPLAGRVTAGARCRHAGGDPAAQRSDPHHEELVQVAGEDRGEPDPLEQRDVGVAGELEDPAVEVQPAGRPVQEPVRGQPGRVRRGCRDGVLDLLGALVGVPRGFRLDVLWPRGGCAHGPHRARRTCWPPGVARSGEREVNGRRRLDVARSRCVGTGMACRAGGVLQCRMAIHPGIEQADARLEIVESVRPRLSDLSAGRRRPADRGSSRRADARQRADLPADPGRAPGPRPRAAPGPAARVGLRSDLGRERPGRRACAGTCRRRPPRSGRPGSRPACR